MTARELFESIGSMDDDLVLAADEEPLRRRRSWQPVLYRAAPLAACLCLVAGAVLWQGRQGVSGGTAPETAMMQASPSEDSTAAAAPPDNVARSEEAAGESSDSTADKPQTVEEFSAAANVLSASAFPADLADLLDTGSVYTMSMTPAPADRTELKDTLLPDTIPVYAGMASSRSIDTDGMYSRLCSMLQALGLDTALADDAVYTGLPQEEAGAQADALQQNGGSEGDALRFWSCAAELVLEVAPNETWPQGLVITAENNGTVTARVPGTEAATAALRETAADTAQTILADWPEVAALAGQEPAAQICTGTDGGWHTRFYDTADRTCQGIESGDLRSVEVAQDENGDLCLVVWHNTNLNTLVGEYTPVTRQEADELLAQNLFLTDGGSLDGNAVLENLVNLRLVYTNNRAGAWYLPYWCYTADEGPAGEDDSLHIYGEYLVPAVSLQDLEALADPQ